MTGRLNPLVLLLALAAVTLAYFGSAFTGDHQKQPSDGFAIAAANRQYYQGHGSYIDVDIDVPPSFTNPDDALVPMTRKHDGVLIYQGEQPLSWQDAGTRVTYELQVIGTDKDLSQLVLVRVSKGDALLIQHAPMDRQGRAIIGLSPDDYVVASFLYEVVGA